MTAISVKDTRGKAYRGVGMEGALAKWYAGLTRKSLAQFQALARRVAGQVPPGSRVLEVAPGPGFFAVALARLGDYHVVGLDISRTFVDIARRNAAEAQVDVDFREGNASSMPFESDSFDFLLCRAAFKNFSEPLAALGEMHRVLKPGGQALIIDLRRDATRESIAQAVDGMGLGAVNRLITKLTFRFVLLKRAYSKGEFASLLAQTGFRTVEIREDAIGLEIEMGK
ncbi:MAG TPA: class I SAM-dependent methyltransferase [Planctomycetaceae bacterium]|nr:class I SAM-dependent methyltransferase [Planctomycetaceae bacterium]